MHLANPESITISAVVPGGLGYANEAIIFNKESTYEIALSTEVRANGGGAPVGSLIGAFTPAIIFFFGYSKPTDAVFFLSMAIAIIMPIFVINAMISVPEFEQKEQNQQRRRLKVR